MEKDKNNPLKSTWNIISTIAGAIGLVNVSKDIFLWADFFQLLLAQYRNIVYWPFEILPFKIPNLLKDYLFFGTLFITISNRYKSHRGSKFNLWILIFWLTWPAAIVFSIQDILYSGDNDEKLLKKKVELLIWRWIGSVFLIFFVFLLISSMINS